MDKHFYFQCIRRNYLGFLNIFNNLKVHRYNEDNEEVEIKVPLKLAPKRKFFLWVNDKKFEKHYPIMAGGMNSMSFDISRRTDPNFRLTFKDPEKDEILKLLNPIPYNFNYSLNIVSKYLTDMDQILEQIIPFFQPAVIFRITFPELRMNFNVPLNLESVNLDSSNELSLDMIKTYSSTLEFSCQSFIFQPLENEALIKKIIIPHYQNSPLPNGFDTLTVNKEDRKLEGEFEKDKEVQYLEGAYEDGKKIIRYELFDGIERND